MVGPDGNYIVETREKRRLELNPQVSFKYLVNLWLIPKLLSEVW